MKNPSALCSSRSKKARKQNASSTFVEHQAYDSSLTLRAEDWYPIKRTSNPETCAILFCLTLFELSHMAATLPIERCKLLPPSWRKGNPKLLMRVAVILGRTFPESEYLWRSLLNF